MCPGIGRPRLFLAFGFLFFFGGRGEGNKGGLCRSGTGYGHVKEPTAVSAAAKAKLTHDTGDLTTSVSS